MDVARSCANEINLLQKDAEALGQLLCSLDAHEKSQKRFKGVIRVCIHESLDAVAFAGALRVTADYLLRAFSRLWDFRGSGARVAAQCPDIQLLWSSHRCLEMLLGKPSHGLHPSFSQEGTCWREVGNLEVSGEDPSSDLDFHYLSEVCRVAGPIFPPSGSRQDEVSKRLHEVRHAGQKLRLLARGALARGDAFLAALASHGYQPVHSLMEKEFTDERRRLEALTADIVWTTLGGPSMREEDRSWTEHAPWAPVSQQLPPHIVVCNHLSGFGKPVHLGLDEKEEHRKVLKEILESPFSLKERRKKYKIFRKKLRLFAKQIPKSWNNLR